MKSLRTFVKVLLLIIVLVGVLSVFQTANATTLQEMKTKTSDFISKGASGANGIDYGEITKPFANLGSILTFIGAGVMVAITTYMGIKYLISGPEAQAKLKVQLIGVVVSGLVIFGSYYIWKIVVQIFGDI